MARDAPSTAMRGMSSFVAGDNGPLLHVERLGAGHLAVGVGGDLVDAGLGLPQQFLAAPLQRLAALVDRNRLLQRQGAAGGVGRDL